MPPLPVFVVIVIVIVCVREYCKGKVLEAENSRIATDKDCDANERLAQWCIANQGRQIRDDAFAHTLVKECIETREEFLRTHPFFVDRGHTAWLQSFLTPPQSPKKRKGASRRARPRIA